MAATAAKYSQDCYLQRVANDLIRDFTSIRMSDPAIADRYRREHVLVHLRNVYEMGILEGRARGTQAAINVMHKTLEESRGSK
jgi:hypothetical protein